MNIRVAPDHDLRIGQFINDALRDYLAGLSRDCSEQEIASCLFYLSDDELSRILKRYSAILDARSDLRSKK